jgi:hypothetical protein
MEQFQSVKNMSSGFTRPAEMFMSPLPFSNLSSSSSNLKLRGTAKGQRAWETKSMRLVLTAPSTAGPYYSASDFLYLSHPPSLPPSCFWKFHIRGKLPVPIHHLLNRPAGQHSMAIFTPLKFITSDSPTMTSAPSAAAPPPPPLRPPNMLATLASRALLRDDYTPCGRGNPRWELSALSRFYLFLERTKLVRIGSISNPTTEASVAS